MKISAKGRYALTSMIYIAQNSDKGQHFTLVSISENLGISKLYLEQVFNLLKKGNLVNSIKGAQGGYRLSRDPKLISVYDILFEFEQSLFELAEKTVSDKHPEIDNALRLTVFEPIDITIKEQFKGITLHDLVIAAEKSKKNDIFMYYI
ncbi:MAG: transcriptional regulator [Bacillales bacterium]|jgi:Rrf2 family protein|nr:transcriptional regulator [Bacillales bacterium]